MKAKLKFNLDNPDDRMSHLRCIKSLDLSLCLYDIMNVFRTELKYNESITTEEVEMIEDIRNKCIDVLNNYHINLDELIN